MGSCRINVPTLKNDNVDSLLFKDLLAYTGDRETSKAIWGLANSPDFLEGRNIEYDINGEPTIESLLEFMDIPNENLNLKSAKNLLGATDKNGKLRLYNDIEDILYNVINFNKTNKKFVATINKLFGKYTISVTERDDESINQVKDLMFKNSLNNKLRNILNKLGYDVEVDLHLREHGVFDVVNAKENADGLKTVIRIAKGLQGEDAFPEEFSHLIIEGLKENKLIQRLFNIIDNEMIQVVLDDLYDRYYDIYNGDFSLLQKEAAGKMLQEYITNRESNSSLMQRILNKIKDDFAKGSIEDVLEAIDLANMTLNLIAEGIKDESILVDFDKTSVLNSLKLFALHDEITKSRELAEKGVDVLSKRLKLELMRSVNKRYDKYQADTIKDLLKSINQKKYFASTVKFVLHTNAEIEKIVELLNEIKSGEKDNLKLICRTLRSIKEFSEGYSPIMKELMNLDRMVESGEIDDLSMEDLDNSGIMDKIMLINKNISYIQDNYKELRTNAVIKFLEKFWGKDKVINFGKDKKKIITLKMIIEKAEKDINFFDRMISSLGDASDPMLLLVNKAYMHTKYNIDDILIEITKEAREEERKLLLAGYNNSFMYERDKNGKLTGRIISEYDYERFERELKEYELSLKKQGLKWWDRKNKVDNWKKKHTKPIKYSEETVIRVPIYENPKLVNLAPAQREYYDKMMNLKKNLDSMIPLGYADTYKAVLIRDDELHGIITNLSNPRLVVKQIIGNIKDGTVRRVDLVGNEDKSNTILDFAGNEVKTLPIYYTKDLEDMDRLSTDFTSSILAYAGMAVNFSEMNKVIDQFEITRDLIRDRDVLQVEGDNPLKQTFTILGKKFIRNYVKPGSNTAISARLDDYFDTVMYLQGRKDEGKFDLFGYEVDLASLSDSIKKYTGDIGLGLNAFSGMSNVTVGKMLLFIEEMAGLYFGFKDAQIGKAKYYKYMKDVMAECATPFKTNKLDLLIQKFDLEVDMQKSLRELGRYSSNMARIMKGCTNIYMLNGMGEHYLHSRAMLAMLLHLKVKLNGKIISLEEAFYVDKKIENGKVVSAELKIKQGATLYYSEKDLKNNPDLAELNGKDVTDSFLHDLKLKMKKVSDTMNGAFNEVDRGAIHRYALGRLAMLFRLWMPAHYYRRFLAGQLDLETGTYREGYYRTLGRFACNTILQIRKMNFNIATMWDELSNEERLNLVRAATEIGMFASLSGLIMGLGPIKDKKGNWLDRMIMYNLYRMKLETGASVPFPLSPDFIDNAWTLLLSPAAAIKPFNHVTNLLKFWNMFNEVESGRYEGMSVWEKEFITTIPLLGLLRKLVDIADEDYMFTPMTKNE